MEAVALTILKIFEKMLAKSEKFALILLKG